MAGMLTEWREKLLPTWRDYGTLFLISFFFVVSIVCASVIVQDSSPSPLTVAFLDVGQGDAIFIQTPRGHQVLIDGGPSDSILARLDERMSYFDRSLDMIIATHDDSDHITGLIPVLKKYEVGHTVISPVRADTELAHVLASSVHEEVTSLHVGTRGDVINFGDGVMMYVLYPPSSLSPKDDTNDASVSVVLIYGEHSFLLTGDLPSKYESRLLTPHLSKHVTVFKAGHHGSNTSSGEALLSYIKPEYAVISAGKDNRYGHPHKETLERLARYAKETMSTAASGTIIFESDGRVLMVEAEK